VIVQCRVIALPARLNDLLHCPPRRPVAGNSICAAALIWFRVSSGAARGAARILVDMPGTLSYFKAKST